jgi:hypothetical protein
VAGLGIVILRGERREWIETSCSVGLAARFARQVAPPRSPPRRRARHRVGTRRARQLDERRAGARLPRLFGDEGSVVGVALIRAQRSWTRRSRGARHPPAGARRGELRRFESH